MEWFFNSFRGHVHKVFVMVPAKFGGFQTSFDHPIIDFSNWKSSSFSRAEFFIITGWTGVHQWSTGDQGFLSVTGFLVCAPVDFLNPRFSYTGALSFCLLIIGSTGALWVRLCLSGQLHRCWFRFYRIIRCYYTGWTDAVQTYTSDQPVLVFLMLQALYHRLNRRTQVYVYRINRWYIPCWISCCSSRLLPCLFLFVPRVVLCWCSSSIAIPHFT